MVRWIVARLTLTQEGRRQSWYVPILVLAMVLMMFRLLGLARFLGVEEFGYFNIGLLVSSTFSMSGCLGLQTMLRRDSPGQFIRGEEQQVELLTVQSCLVALVLCTLGLVVTGVFSSFLTIDGNYIALGFLHGLSQQLFLIATIESRSRGDVLRFSLQNLLRSTTIFATSLVVAAQSNSAAILLIVEASISIALSLCFVAGGFRSQMNLWSRIKTSCALLPRIRWTVAFMLLGTSIYGILLNNGDRWIASSVLTISQFAQYSFAWIILAAAQNVQSVISASAFPYVAVRFEKQGSRAAFAVCATIAFWIGLLLLVLSIPAFLFISFAIEAWFPEYHSAIPLIPIFLCIGILRVSDFWRTFMLVCGLERKLVYFNSLNLAAAIAFVVAADASGFLAQIDSVKVAYLALLINLMFVGTTALASFFNRGTPQ